MFISTKIAKSRDAERMMEKLPVLRFAGEAKNIAEDVVAREFPLKVILNDQEFVTLFCSPTNLEYLVLGFLFSQGIILKKEEIKEITINEYGARVKTKGKSPSELSKQFIASSGSREIFQSVAKVESELQVKISEAFTLMKEFQYRSKVYKATGGTHSAALGDRKGILFFSEDIGRHNAIDKVFGECFLKGIPMADYIILTSGRISSEILLKVAKRNVPIIISKSAPLNLSVKLADDLGISLIGFVRGRRMNVYANSWRII